MRNFINGVKPGGMGTSTIFRERVPGTKSISFFQRNEISLAISDIPHRSIRESMMIVSQVASVKAQRENL